MGPQEELRGIVAGVALDLVHHDFSRGLPRARNRAIAQARARGSWGDYSGGPAAGLSLSSVDWLAEREVAAVATDTWGMEVRPNETPDVFQPLHIVFIVHMGMWIGEIFDLDPLAADCAGDGVYEFMFCGPPLPFTHAVGSPLNPMAIK